MLEKVYRPTQSNLKTIETVVDAPTVMLNHMILPEGEGLPEHTTNANLCMIITQGKMSLLLENETLRQYEAWQVLEIPEGVRMNLQNFESEVLEFYVVKTPNPKAKT